MPDVRLGFLLGLLTLPPSPRDAPVVQPAETPAPNARAQASIQMKGVLLC